MRLVHVVLLVAPGLLAACERADAPVPTDPTLPAPEVERLVPEPIISDRSHVEHPPALPPGAAWFHRLTRSEQSDIEWICKSERADPCWGLFGLRPLDQADAARFRGVQALLGRDFERHCTQELGRRRGCNTPLVVAFAGEPVAFRSDAGAFAFGATAVTTDWPTAATPWIALDRNGDGIIDRGDELFGDAVPGAHDGFEALAQLDANHDGRIDRDDPAFASLVLWADRDGDRRGTADELTPLASVVTQIPLANQRDVRCDGRGDCEGERGTLLWRDATGAARTGAVVDVYLPER